MKNIWNLWFIMGLGFAVIGGFILIQQFTLHKQCTEQTQGIVGTAHQFNRPYLILTFTANGEEHTAPLSGSNDFSDGQTVTVIYNPSNIKRYYILEDKSSITTVGIGCTIGGLILALCGYGIYTGVFSVSRTSRLRRK